MITQESFGGPWGHRKGKVHSLWGNVKITRQVGRPRGPSLSWETEVGAGEQGAVRTGLGGPGSRFTSVAMPLGKERET